MINHDIFLTRLRWQTATGEFSEMNSFITDCFEYDFIKPLESEQQNDFMKFIGDSDNFNSLSVLDFCNYFLKQNIPFKLKFRYCRKREVWFNLNCYKIAKYLQKELKSIEFRNC